MTDRQPLSAIAAMHQAGAEGARQHVLIHLVQNLLVRFGKLYGLLVDCADLIKFCRLAPVCRWTSASVRCQNLAPYVLSKVPVTKTSSAGCSLTEAGQPPYVNMSSVQLLRLRMTASVQDLHPPQLTRNWSLDPPFEMKAHYLCSERNDALDISVGRGSKRRYYK